jgi:hypothetical protein
MKYVITLIYILYIIVYGYSAYMTSVAPNELRWGYICVFVFAFLFIWGVSIFTKHSNTNSEKKPEDL